MISITAFGRVPAGRMVHRSGAKPGDRVVVTGTIGDATLGLDILKGGAVAAALADDAAARECLAGRYRVPQPRNALAQAVREHAHAAMDVSDGLAGDLAKLCAAPAFRPSSMHPAIPLSAPRGELLARGVVGIEALGLRRRRLRVLCIVPEDGFAASPMPHGRPGSPYARSAPLLRATRPPALSTERAGT